MKTIWIRQYYTMELKAPSRESQQHNKNLIINEFNNYVLNLFNFYVSNKIFIIPNDLIEGISSLLGFYFAESYTLDSEVFQKNKNLIRRNIAINTEKGFYLAELFKEHQENLIAEINNKSLFAPIELPYVLLTLDINLQLSHILLADNKQTGIQLPTNEIESRFNVFVRQYLLDTWNPFVDNTDELTNDFIINELTIYLGWITGFYANLLESTAELFSTYTFICVEMAINQKSKH